MHRKRKIAYSYTIRVISFLMAVFVLNLCVQVPVSHRFIYTQDALGNSKIEKKVTRKFLLELVADYITDSETRIPDTAMSNLLEELKEVKEGWCHHHHDLIRFHAFHDSKKHGESHESLFRLMEDSRLSPPPEQV